MLRVVCVLLLVSTVPASAKVLPGVWDGTCKSIPPINQNHLHAPGSWKGQGYIPPDMPETDEDIRSCNLPPANGMGPK